MYAKNNVNLNMNIFKCNVCTKLLNHPLQLSPCGHRVCMACLPGAQPQLCLVCDKEPTCTPPNFSDVGFRLEMQSIKAKCKKCNLVFYLTAFKHHQQECYPEKHEFDTAMICANVDGSRFQCPICYSCFISTPIQFQCGHRFCISCCEDITGNTCPMCRSEIHPETSFFDIGIMNDLNVSEITCSNENCQWSGLYDDLLIHEKCHFKICSVCEKMHLPKVDCRLPCQKCRRLILAEQLDAHKEECDDYVDVPSYLC